MRSVRPQAALTLAFTVASASHALSACPSFGPSLVSVSEIPEGQEL